MGKVKLPENTGIAIQGSTTWTDTVIEFWSNFDVKVVWGTWSDEPAKNILKIERAGIHVVLIDKPKYEGYLNYNLQSLSSLAAIQTLLNYDVKHVLKIRSDCLLYGIEKIWPIGADISFMYAYNPQKSTPFVYHLDGKNHFGLDFPLDHAFFGNIDTMLHVMGGYEETIRRTGPVPPEALILKRWLDFKNLEHNFDIDFLKKNGLHFWGQDALTHLARLIWLKNNWDMTGMLYAERHLRIF